MDYTHNTITAITTITADTAEGREELLASFPRRVRVFRGYLKFWQVRFACVHLAHEGLNVRSLVSPKPY
jgi:hypothetical protein